MIRFNVLNFCIDNYINSNQTDIQSIFLTIILNNGALEVIKTMRRIWKGRQGMGVKGGVAKHN